MIYDRCYLGLLYHEFFFLQSCESPVTIRLEKYGSKFQIVSEYMKVLNFGSLNVDHVYRLPHVVQVGETISSSSIHVYPGGKGLNQSIALGKAGVEVYHAGAVGRDGMFLLDILCKAGVDTHLIRILEDESTGHAIIQNDDDGDNAIILYGGANQRMDRQHIDRVLESFGAGDFLVLQNEINELAYLVDSAYEKGMQIVLNPSPMNEIILGLSLEKIAYFILNEIEAAQILGLNPQKTEGDLLLNGLSRRFPSARIILTLGGEGSMYTDGAKVIHQPIYQVKAVDTTAAGDTFSGYFLAGLIKGMSMEESMDLAAKASAIAVTRNGAGVSIPEFEEVLFGELSRKLPSV